MEEKNYAYWLANISGIGNRTIAKLLAQTDSAEELYRLSEKQTKMLKGLKEKDRHALLESKHKYWEKEYEEMLARGISFVSLEDGNYPKRLRKIEDAPFGLYIKGTLPNEAPKTVAVVGARRCSAYGRAVAKRLGKAFADNGVQVISGMADGIDAAGHWGALEGKGTTIAVLGCGVDVCYPAANRALYEEIIKNGAVLSEYPPKTAPLAGYFPARNRIIAGLCDVVIVVEAKKRSGSLITADLALEQGKDIYAVPGRIFDELSDGCNMLIYQGAGIISDIENLLAELEVSLPTVEQPESFAKLSLEKEERLVYSCVDLRPKSLEELLQLTGCPLPQLIDVLACLVRKGFITEIFKNRYIRCM